MNPNGGANPPGWCGRFRRRGYRITEPRRAILDVLSNTTEHLSAEDIYLAVHKVYPGIGLTTVYRTLELLVNLGLISKFQFGDGRSRYELIEDSQPASHHHHLICRNCHRIIDYSDFMEEEIEFLNGVKQRLSQKFNFKINNHIIQFYGLCEDCRNRS